MTEPAGGIPPAPENLPSTEALNPFAALAGAVMSPGETFEKVAARPAWQLWLVPIVIFVILSIVTTVMFMPKFDFESAVREQLSRQGQAVDDAQVETLVKIQRPIIYTTAVIGTPFVLLILALVYMLGFKAFGGEGRFVQYFAITTLAWIPQVLKAIVASIVIATRESVRIEELQTIVMSNPGALADPMEKPALFSLLSSFDVFTFWTMILMIIGYGIVSKRPKGQSIGIVVAIWLIYVIGKTGFALLGQMMQSGA